MSDSKVMEEIRAAVSAYGRDAYYRNAVLGESFDKAIALIESAIAEARRDVISASANLVLANNTQRADEYGAGWNAAIAHVAMQLSTLSTMQGAPLPRAPHQGGEDGQGS